MEQLKEYVSLLSCVDDVKAKNKKCINEKEHVSSWDQREAVEIGSW